MTEKAKKLVLQHSGNANSLTIDDLVVVWFGYILGFQKWVIATTDKHDNSYFEVTYNKAKDEFYLDRYQKDLNVLIPASCV